MIQKPHITFLEKLSTYSYPELFSLWFTVNIVCAVIYFALASVHNSNAPSTLAGMDTAARLFNSIYFSVVTGTSVGYGDIVPQGFSKVLAMSQAILSLLIFAIFVTKLVSRRQDITLKEVHRMTSESIFYNIRQGLFLVRKDFDILMHEIEMEDHMTEQEWEILTTAFLQGQNLIEEIPNLYNGQGHDLYVIDEKREHLLLEAIHRTFRRIEKLLEVMDSHHIDWRGHAESREELMGLLAIMDASMPLWRERSPTPRAQLFDDVVRRAHELHMRVK